MRCIGKIDFDGRPQYDTVGLITSAEVNTISGSLQINIDSKTDTNHTHDNRYYTEGEVGTISGSLRTDIDIVTDTTIYADSPMTITGADLSLGTNAGTFKVTALTAMLRSTDSLTGTLTYVEKTEEDNIIITLADTTYVVVLNYSGGSPTISIVTGMPNKNSNIPLGKVRKTSGGVVFFATGGYTLQDGVAKLHMRAKSLKEIELLSGSAISYSGTNNFTMGAGTFYGGLNKFTTAEYDSAATQFYTIHQDSGAGWTTSSGNAIDYAHYDDGDGTLGTISNNKYGCFWVYKHVSDGHVFILYGRGDYTLAEAESTEEPTKPTHLTSFGALVGRIVAPHSGGSFTSIQMATATVFTGTAVSTHNNLGGLNDDDYKHLTAANHTDLTDGNDCSIHTHGDLYYTESEVDTISGSLQTNIDGKANSGANSDITSMTGLNDDGIPVAKVDGALANVSEDTTPDLGGQLGVGEYDIKLDSSLSADEKYSGETFDGTLGETVGFGNLVYLKSDRKWWKTDADAEATSGNVQLAITLVSGIADETKLLMKNGFVRDDSWTFTSYGQAIFVSCTAGEMTETAPSATGDIVRVVAYASTVSGGYQIEFAPSQTWIELS